MTDTITVSKTTFCQEHKDKIRQARIGKKHSEETKQKMKESQRRNAALRKKSVGVSAQTGLEV